MKFKKLFENMTGEPTIAQSVTADDVSTLLREMAHVDSFETVCEEILEEMIEEATMQGFGGDSGKVKDHTDAELERKAKKARQQKARAAAEKRAKKKFVYTGVKSLIQKALEQEMGKGSDLSKKFLTRPEVEEMIDKWKRQHPSPDKKIVKELLKNYIGDITRDAVVQMSLFKMNPESNEHLLSDLVTHIWEMFPRILQNYDPDKTKGGFGSYLSTSGRKRMFNFLKLVTKSEGGKMPVSHAKPKTVPGEMSPEEKKGKKRKFEGKTPGEIPAYDKSGAIVGSGDEMFGKDDAGKQQQRWETIADESGQWDPDDVERQKALTLRELLYNLDEVNPVKSFLIRAFWGLLPARGKGKAEGGWVRDSLVNFNPVTNSEDAAWLNKNLTSGLKMVKNPTRMRKAILQAASIAKEKGAGIWGNDTGAIARAERKIREELAKKLHVKLGDVADEEFAKLRAELKRTKELPKGYALSGAAQRKKMELLKTGIKGAVSKNKVQAMINTLGSKLDTLKDKLKSKEFAADETEADVKKQFVTTKQKLADAKSKLEGMETEHKKTKKKIEGPSAEEATKKRYDDLLKKKKSGEKLTRDEMEYIISVRRAQAKDKK